LNWPSQSVIGDIALVFMTMVPKRNLAHIARRWQITLFPTGDIVLEDKN
jgi:hypothetical protein